MSLKLELFFSSWQTSYPFFFGIITSRNIRFGFDSRTLAMASSPSPAEDTSYPSFLSTNVSVLTTLGSSSTTSIFLSGIANASLSVINPLRQGASVSGWPRIYYLRYFYARVQSHSLLVGQFS